MRLNDFSLLKDESDHYVIGHPKGKSIKVPKAGMSDRAQKLIAGLKKEQGMAFGGGAFSGLSDPYAGEKPFGEQVKDSLEIGGNAIKDGFNNLGNTVIFPKEEEPKPPMEELKQVELEETPKLAEKVVEELPAPPAQKEEPLKSHESAELKAKEDLDYIGEAGKLVQQSQDLYNERRKKYDQEAATLRQAILDHTIDPDRYWHNADTGSKIAASIGMAISGIGSALSGQSNYALDNINRAINADILSQKEDKSNLFTLWKMNREALGSDTAATLKSQAQMLEFAKSKIHQNLASAQSAHQRASADKLVLEMDQQKAALNDAQALEALANQPSPGGLLKIHPSKLVNIRVPEKDRKKVDEEIELAEWIKRAGTSALNAFDEAVKQKNSLGSTFGKDSPGLIRLHGELGPTISRIENTVGNVPFHNVVENVSPTRTDTKAHTAARRKFLTNYFKFAARGATALRNRINLRDFEATNVDNIDVVPGSVIERK